MTEEFYGSAQSSEAKEAKEKENSSFLMESQMGMRRQLLEPPEERPQQHLLWWSLTMQGLPFLPPSPFLFSLTFGFISSFISFFPSFFLFLKISYTSTLFTLFPFPSPTLPRPSPIHDLIFNYYYVYICIYKYSLPIPSHVAFMCFQGWPLGIGQPVKDSSTETTDSLPADVNCLQLLI